MFAAYVPCIPSIPSESASEPGNAPIPMSVVVTGRESARESSASSPEAFDRITPPPA